MAVIKEWKCQSCGFFESAYPVCIRCGSEEVLRVFLTAPSFKCDKTKFVDAQTRHFVKNSSLADYTNNPSTIHAKRNDAIWKDMPKVNGRMNLAGELASIVGGGLNIADLKPFLGGQYEAIRHAEDTK